MSVGSIETILHDHLHMSKVSARWVPRLLTPNQKEQRDVSCKELIELESKDTRFFDRIVTMVETWVHHFDPEMKSSSMQWKAPSSLTPKKARVEPFEWFESHPKSYYAQGLLKVKERWQKCVDMQGDYVKK